MKYSNLLCIIVLLLVSCNTTGKEYDLDNVRVIKGAEVKELIKKTQYSAIYLWTTWCGPCRSTLKKKIKPIMDTNSRDDFQVLIVAVSKNPEQVQDIISKAGITQEVYVVNDYALDAALTDKMKMNKIISSIDDDIDFINRVPVTLIVDNNSKVYGEAHHTSDLINFVEGKLVP